MNKKTEENEERMCKRMMELKVKVNLENSSLLKELIEAIDEFNKAINRLEEITTKLGEIQVGIKAVRENNKFIPESSNGICTDLECNKPY